MKLKGLYSEKEKTDEAAGLKTTTSTTLSSSLQML